MVHPIYSKFALVHPRQQCDCKETLYKKTKTVTTTTIWKRKLENKTKDQHTYISIFPDESSSQESDNKCWKMFKKFKTFLKMNVLFMVSSKYTYQIFQRYLCQVQRRLPPSSERTIQSCLYWRCCACDWPDLARVLRSLQRGAAEAGLKRARSRDAELPVSLVQFLNLVTSF